MEWRCVVVRENAGEWVDSARLSRDAKYGEAAAGVGRGLSAGPLGEAATILAVGEDPNRMHGMDAERRRCWGLLLLTSSSSPEIYV